MMHPKTWLEFSKWEKFWLKINPWAWKKWINEWIEFYETNLPKVYDHITGGRLSYPAYLPDVIIAEYEENVNDLVQFEIDNFIEDNELDINRKWIR